MIDYEENSKQMLMELIKHIIDEKFDGNKAKASEAWDIPNDNLYKWLRGDRTPRLENLMSILNKVGMETIINLKDFDKITSIKNFLGIKDSDKPVSVEISHGGETILPTMQQKQKIPVYNINCPTPTREEASPISHMTPCPQFPEADFAIFMEDYHVMQNSLPEGSVIGVKTIDHRSKFIKSGHIYLMWWEHEGLVVRYAYLDQSTKEVKCIADHDDQEKFPPQFFPVEQAQQFVVGRVVWCMARV